MSTDQIIGAALAFLAGWVFKLVFEQLGQIRQNTRELYQRDDAIEKKLDARIHAVEHKVKDEKIERLEMVIDMMKGNK